MGLKPSLRSELTILKYTATDLNLITTMNKPPFGLRNPHVQTILSSVGPRRVKILWRFRQYRQAQQEMILQADDGARLLGFYNRAGQQQSSQLVILLHGWEGSHDSSYMLSMATALLQKGVDVFRLNLRDHGDSHHLNPELFNSTMVGEVMSAIEGLQNRLEYQETVLGGFSLGANFCCRIAALAHNRPIRISKVVAFCPVLHARVSNDVLNTPENRIYGQYFARKWKKSLRKKLRYFPDIGYANELDELKTLDQMNRTLVPKYTPYKDMYEYFDAYAITGGTMLSTVCPCYLHFSKDDMIIPYQNIKQLALNDQLHTTVTEYGGHCGFLMNWRFDSWQDQRMLELL